MELSCSRPDARELSQRAVDLRNASGEWPREDCAGPRACRVPVAIRRNRRICPSGYRSLPRVDCREKPMVLRTIWWA